MGSIPAFLVYLLNFNFFKIFNFELNFFYENINKTCVKTYLKLHKTINIYSNFAVYVYVYFFRKKNFNFFFNKITLKKNFKISFYFNFFFKITALFFILFFFFLIFSFSLENVPFFKLIFIWASFLFLMYILVSGFNFFGKKYMYNRYTESLQRFWKRSFSLFWLLEGFVFIAFVYLTFNSSSEVVYSYDLQFFFKTHLVSFRFFFFNLILINFLLFNFFFLNILIKNKTFNFLFFLTSFGVVILFLIETIQFLSLLNHIFFFDWIFNQNNEFSLDSDLRKSRIVNSYIFLLGGAKYLHVIFIFFIWFFNFSKSFENNENKYYILSSCIQNTLILFFLNIISLYSVIKYYIRTYLYNNYFWFFLDIKTDFFFDVLNSLFLLYFNFLKF